MEHYNIKDKEKMVFISYGTDFYKKLNLITDKDIKKQREIWGNPDLIIGYVGRLVKYKGALILLQAFHNLLKKGYNNIKLVIIGSGENQPDSCEKELKEYIKDNKIEKQVIFTGQRKNIFLLMPSLDICCFPNILPEGFGITIIEAMMSGVPIIASDLPEFNKIIKQKDLGVLVEANNSEKLSLAIKELILDAEKRKNIAKKAKEYALNYYSFIAVNQKMEQIYKIIKYNYEQKKN